MVILAAVVTSTYIVAATGYVGAVSSAEDIVELYIQSTVHAVASNASRNIEYSLATAQLTAYLLTSLTGNDDSSTANTIAMVAGAIRTSGATFVSVAVDNDSSDVGVGKGGYLGFRMYNGSVLVAACSEGAVPIIFTADLQGNLTLSSINSTDWSVSTIQFNNPHRRNASSSEVGRGNSALGKFVVLANNTQGSQIYAPALSIGIPLPGIGWLWLDMFIDELPAFISMLVVPVQIALVTADGRLFAASKSPPRRYTSAPSSLPLATDSSNALVREGIKTILMTYGSQFSSIAGSVFTVDYKASGYGRVRAAIRQVEFTNMYFPLYAAAFIPRKDWDSTLYSNLRLQLVICAIVSVVCSCLAFVCVRFVTRPLLRLEQAMQRVMRLDFSETVSKYRKKGSFQSLSVVSETRAMQISFLKMRKAVKAFSSYLQPSVVRVVLDSTQFQGLSMRETPCTIYFSDIESFTSISEGLSPSTLVVLVGEYLQEMSGIILETGGTIDKYIGDAIMAFWNAPDPVVDHPYQAVVAAVNCQRRLSELRERWETEGKPAMKCRIGLNTGVVLVGNYGCSTKMDFTVIGDPVNVASRLEGLNKKYGTYLLISEEVESHATVRSTFIMRPLGRVVVKGKSVPIQVFEVVGPLEGTAPSVKQAADLYSSAMQAFYSRHFMEAMTAFEKFASLPEYHKDIASIDMIAQCRRLIAQPPASDWNGVDVLHEKF
eukprot:TRINITY_DN1475_c0_g1_i1.p1 TRINITY_DN1475_c0_g1~~TRINITY_DN1475_c0_g1_i1.p1  ORF type:complete len:802 (+),score=99.40 TRINITY_DN1475_c0_g1_i1:259-2406(+)